MTRLLTWLGPSRPYLRLAGPRLYLRPPTRADWAAWSAVRGGSRLFLTPWEPSWPDDALGRAAFRRRLARCALDWQEDEGYNFFIFRSTDAQILGGIGLSNVRRGVAETASLGYWIGESYARQGYMTEATRLVQHYAFDRLQLHRLEAACLPNNQPSRGLLEKSGFVEEGLARQYLCINGRWQDHVLYAMLREDWDRRRSRL